MIHIIIPSGTCYKHLIIKLPENIKHVNVNNIKKAERWVHRTIISYVYNDFFWFKFTVQKVYTRLL